MNDVAIAREGHLTFEVVVERDISVHADDGTTLVADVFRPARDGQPLPGPFPVAVERTPYGRDRAPLVEMSRRAAQRGYVFVLQDVRGRGDSGGTFGLYMNDPDEGEDGAATMRWILEQSWCDGRIGSVGGSFSAANQQSMALHRPTGLRAQVLRDAGSNYYSRGMRAHGAFNVGLCLPWVVDAAATGHESQRNPAVKVELEGMRRHFEHWFRSLPLRRGESPLALAAVYEDLYVRMCETADDSPFWDTPTARLEGRWDDYPTDVALLMVSGWFSHHAGGNLEKFAQLRSRTRRPMRLIVGPWIHGPSMLEGTVAGDAEFGAEASNQGPVFDTYFAWLDRFVRDLAGSAEGDDLVHYFTMGLGDGHRTAEGRIFHGGEWRTTQDWPPEGTQLVPYFLRSCSQLSLQSPPDDGARTSYDFDPADPCPTVGATNLQALEPESLFLPGPRDQYSKPGAILSPFRNLPPSDRRDVCVFQTEPLSSAVEVTGPVELSLWVESSAKDTDFTAKLIDVYPPDEQRPRGYAMLLCEDILRMRYRDGRSVGELMEPGQTYEARISLGPTSNLFKPGHRIRVDVSSSSFPEYDVNPNTGEPLGCHTHSQVAHQTIFHHAKRPSFLELPIVTSPQPAQYLPKEESP